MGDLPLVKGARGMFRPHGITCPMEHPPAPLHKGETNFCVNRNIIPNIFSSRDLYFPKICLYLQSLQINTDNYEKHFTLHLELLCRWLPEHDIGSPPVDFDFPESHRLVFGTPDVLLRAGAFGQDRGTEDRACGEGVDEVISFI